MKITLATHNDGKLMEFSELLPDYELVSLTSFDFALPEETGTTYEENSLIKARAAREAIGGVVLADDSGLSIDCLDGAPGLYSSRFAGIEADYDDKIEAIWHLLDGFPPEQWTASFFCVLALILSDGETRTFEGRVDGLILPEKRGTNGFGFDPIFYVPHLGKTTAELSHQDKNAISHRGLAVQKLRRFLQELKGPRKDA